MRLKGKNVIITAAASGMGEAGCEIFAREGANVFAVDINKDSLDAVVSKIRAAGGNVQGMVADLLDLDVCQNVIAQGVETLGGLDVVWNHAGIAGRGGVEEIDFDEYERCLDLNLRSSLVISGKAIPHLRKSSGGAIVLTASIAGLVGSPSSAIYTASKFAVVGLCKSMAVKYAPENIRVNAVCPGGTDTPMLPSFFDPDASPEAAKAAQTKALSGVPMGRYARPEEVAYAAAWLASDEASFITGVALPVDGGFTAR